MTEQNASPPEPKPRKSKKSAATEARQAEADGDGYVTVEQCGVKLRIPVGGKITVAAVDTYRDGDNYGGTKILIGEQQWEKLRAAGMTMDDLDELGKKIRDASGN